MADKKTNPLIIIGIILLAVFLFRNTQLFSISSGADIKYVSQSICSSQKIAISEPQSLTDYYLEYCEDNPSLMSTQDSEYYLLNSTGLILSDFIAPDDIDGFSSKLGNNVACLVYYKEAQGIRALDIYDYSEKKSKHVFFKNILAKCPDGIREELQSGSVSVTTIDSPFNLAVTATGGFIDFPGVSILSCSNDIYVAHGDINDYNNYLDRFTQCLSEDNKIINQTIYINNTLISDKSLCELQGGTILISSVGPNMCKCENEAIVNLTSLCLPDIKEETFFERYGIESGLGAIIILMIIIFAVAWRKR